MQPSVAPVGPPDLKLAGLQVWVHGYQFPELDDEWDGNWLRVTAHCGSSGADVWVGGAILDTVSFYGLRKGLTEIHRTMTGKAELSSLEPELKAFVEMVDKLGHLTVRVEITPDHMSQHHWFEFEADQSHLPAIVSQCDALLARHPVRGKRERLGV